jgi:hypothetical protein
LHVRLESLTYAMHNIRLRGPWQVEAIERYVRRADGTYGRSSEPMPAAVRMAMPADWSAALGGDFLGRVRYSRIFQKPTGLDTGERVFLVVEPARSLGSVSVNSKRLGAVCWGGAAGRFDVTDLLDDHNRLEIVVQHPVLDGMQEQNDDDSTSSVGGLVGEVRLEIDE